MRRITGLVACLSCLALVNVAQSAEFIAGVENVRYTMLLKTDVSEEATVFHSWTAFRGDWLMNENFAGRVSVGGITSTLDDKTLTLLPIPQSPTLSNDNGFYVGLGMTMNQNLDSGGGMMIDVSVGWTTNDLTSKVSLASTHTAAKFAYAFGEKGTAQPYFGYSFNTYMASLEGDVAVDYEQRGNHNFIAGVRALNETFQGIMEATLGYEVGVMLALEFGF